MPSEDFSAGQDTRALRVNQLAEALVDQARSAGMTLATAESLTGGLLGSTLASVPGASAVYRGGVISYASEVKSDLLGVEAQLIQERGTVDPEVALSMAQGARRVCGADYGLATTGAAGPEPWDGKPVGRVYLGLTGPAGSRVLERNYEGDRQQIRQQAVCDGLALLLEALAEEAK